MYPAYILSGGKSRRFGSDKARYQTAAGPQLNNLMQKLVDAGHTVHVVADRADRYRDLGIECLVDTQADSGPLAGLASALIHCGQTYSPCFSPGWLLLVNCDQACWDNTWYETLVDNIDSHVTSVTFDDGLCQPLPGLYHIDLLPEINQRLGRRELSFQALLRSTSGHQVYIDRSPSRWSFNTVKDLKILGLDNGTIAE